MRAIVSTFAVILSVYASSEVVGQVYGNVYDQSGASEAKINVAIDLVTSQVENVSSLEAADCVIANALLVGGGEGMSQAGIDGAFFTTDVWTELYKREINQNTASFSVIMAKVQKENSLMLPNQGVDMSLVRKTANECNTKVSVAMAKAKQLALAAKSESGRAK